MLRVGRISYLNVEPFFHAFPWPIAESLPPRALGEAVAWGRVDAGPLALADCLRLEGTVTRLPFGIVGPTRGQSVLLFSDLPMGELGGRRIGVTGETSTSVRLMDVPRKPLAKVEGRKKLKASGLVIQWRGTPNLDDWVAFIVNGTKSRRLILADHTSERRVKQLLARIEPMPKREVEKLAKG